MNNKVAFLHQKAKPESREVSKSKARPSGTAALVREFRSRAQLAEDAENRTIEDSRIWFNDFGEKVTDSYKIGNFNSDFESAQYFNNALCLLGEAICEINFNQERNVRLFNSDINSLSLRDQFHRTILGFLIDMDDKRNISLMKQYLERSMDMKGGDEEEIKDLINNLDDILFATKELITHGYLEVDMSFYVNQDK